VAIRPAPFLSGGRSGAGVGGEPGDQSTVYISTSSFPSFGLLGLDLGCSSPVLPFGAIGGGACSGAASRWCGLAFVVGHAPRRLAPRGVSGLPPLRRLRRLALGGGLDLGALGDASMASLQSWGSCVAAALLLYAFLEACVGDALAVGVALLADESSCWWLGGVVLHQPRCLATASSWRRWNLLIIRFGASTEHVRLVWSSSDAFGKDIFSRNGGSCTVAVISMVAAGAAPGLLSSCSMMAVPVCFPYQQ
jgi:hypothetical protein